MKLLLLAAASMVLVACATQPQSDEVAEPRVFRTGSHLPQRDNGSSSVQSTQGKVINVEPVPFIPSKAGN
jgi:hypothetical protein